jgi:hypothetical protein
MITGDDMATLSERQRAALPFVIAGRTDTETAASIGVHRVTVTRWRLYHPVFRSAVLAAHASDCASAEAARRTLYRAAVDRLTRELADDGPRAVQVALAVVADPPPVARYVSADTLAEEAHAAHLRGILLDPYAAACRMFDRAFGLEGREEGPDPYDFLSNVASSIEGEEADAEPCAG